MTDEPHGSTTAGERAAPATNLLTRIAALSFVAIVVAVVFRPVLDCSALIFDDNYYLTDNALVQNPGWDSTVTFVTEVFEPSTVAGYYQPLAMISLMLDCALGASPDNIVPIQRTSLILHVANSVLVAALMMVLFRSVPAAIAAGLLFGLHPTAVETVPWLAQRKSLLATLFVLASLICYVRYARLGGAGRYALLTLWYVLALLSKPTSTPLPVLLILLDWWPLARLGRRALLEKIPLLAIGGIFAIITVISQSRAGGASMPHDYGPLRIPIMLAHNIVFYIRQFFWPGHLPGYYPFPEPFTPGNPAVIGGFVGIALLAIALALSLKFTRAWVCGWFVMFLAIFPTLGVIGFTDTIAANRFLYLPMIGLLLPIADLVRRLWSAAPACKRRRVAVAAALGLIFGLESFATRRALAHWSTSISYFEHVAARAPGAAKVRYSFGEALDRAGQIDRAIEEYRAAIELKPDYAMARNNLATLLAAEGNLTDAIRHYRRAIAVDPSSFRAYNNLGVALARTGRTEEAAAILQHAVKLNGAFADARFNLGRLLAGDGRFDEAIVHLDRARELQPDDLEILYNLAVALEEAGRAKGALDRYDELLARDPNYADASVRREALRERLGPTIGGHAPP